MYPFSSIRTLFTASRRLLGVCSIVGALLVAGAASAQAAEGNNDPTGTAAVATVRGRILNEEGKPLAGATVLWKGSPYGVTTDLQGNYQLPLAAGRTVVLFSYAGYSDDEISVRGAGVYNVTLLPREPSVAAPSRNSTLEKRIRRVFR